MRPTKKHPLRGQNPCPKHEEPAIKPYVDFYPATPERLGFKSFATVKKIYQVMEAVAGGMGETAACKRVEISLQTYRSAMTRPAFKRHFDKLIDRHTPVIESAAIEAATGAVVWEDKLTRDGDVVRVEKKMPPSPEMLKFMLKNLRKERYSDEKTVNHNVLLQDAIKRARDSSTKDFIDAEVSPQKIGLDNESQAVGSTDA